MHGKSKFPQFKESIGDIAVEASNICHVLPNSTVSYDQWINCC